MTSQGQEVSEDDDAAHKFFERQKAHFDKLLRQKWECVEEGHGVCVPTEDGQHFRLADRDISDWVMALCGGSATTANPPHFIFDNISGGFVFNHTNGGRIVSAVSVAPSRRGSVSHNRPIEISSGSRGNSLLSWGAPRTETATSHSTLIPGPGYFAAKAIRWFGKKGLDGVEYTVILNRYRMHKSCIDKWEKDQQALDADVRTKVFEMLADALEMSKQSYSSKVNKIGYFIGRAVHRWLRTYDDDPQVSAWFIKVQVSLIPILLARVSRVDPLAGDLAHRTLYTLTRVPLEQHGIETTSNVIWHVARELAYAKCTFQHSWLGVWLLRIVEMSLRHRELTTPEKKAIKELAVRRQEQPSEYFGKEDDVWRPWEIALFAQCASQDPWFKTFVIGEYGLPNLISALDLMLADHVKVRDVHWENVALTLRSLAFLSEQKWVAKAVKPEIVKSLLRVFRRSIPERWFCIRFWATDTIRNMVANREELTRTLLEEDALSAFETLTNPQLDHELSANPSQWNPQRHVHGHVHGRPVPPVPPIPTPLLPKPQSPPVDSYSPLTNSPQKDFSLLPPSPADERRDLLPSPVSSVPPFTPSSSTSDRRFTLLGSRSYQSGARVVDRRASTSQSTSSNRSELPQSPTRPNSRPAPTLIPTPTQERLLEEYKVAATKRVEELTVYVRKWTEYSPDKLPTLEVLGAGVGWLSEWEGEMWANEAEP